MQNNDCDFDSVDFKKSTAAGLVFQLAAKRLEIDDIVKVARKRGFDGAIFQNVQNSPTLDPNCAKDLSDVCVAFHPTPLNTGHNPVSMRIALRARSLLQKSPPARRPRTPQSPLLSQKHDKNVRFGHLLLNLPGSGVTFKSTTFVDQAGMGVAAPIAMPSSSRW